MMAQEASDISWSPIQLNLIGSKK